MFRKTWMKILAGIVLLVLAAVVAINLSPWPSAWILRQAFEKQARKVNDALAKHVTEEVTEVLDVPFDAADPDALLDVYYPAAVQVGEQLPLILWIHGGGWISGTRKEVSNYCKVLAGKGYTVVSVEYTIAPEATYPTPIRQANEALRFLVNHADRYHVDVRRLVLAGDSAGANMAAQVANLNVSSAYAEMLGIQPSVEASQLAGLLLFCSAYDIRQQDLDGPYGKFFRVFLWSYSGTKKFMDDPAFQTFKVQRYVTEDFPPAFLSAGNGDPLLPYSESFAQKLRTLGVKVETLFFPADYTPALGHEYQFNLDTEAGQRALQAALAFLSGLG